MSSMQIMAQMDTSFMLISKIDFFRQFKLHDNNEIKLMGYTVSIGGPIDIPSPTLNFTEGDSVNINMWNLSQGPPHTIHLHGLDVDQQNDGVPALSFSVEHDDTGSYYFQAPHPGTYIYHCHETSVLHVQSGMYGLVIVRPASADTLTWEDGYSFHSEQAWLTSEIDTNWHVDSIINHPHDPLATSHLILDYTPQHYLINGKSEQQIDNSDIEVHGSVQEIMYLRLANIGYYGNQFIFPTGLNANIIASDGRPLPAAYNSDTLELLPGERYGILFEANSEFIDSIQVNYFDLNNGNTINTQYADVVISGFVNAKELGLEMEPILVYPNPTAEFINFELPENDHEEYTVSITNMLGERVIEKSISNVPGNKQTVSITGLTKGSYIVVLQSSDNQWTEKIIIQ